MDVFGLIVNILLIRNTQQDDDTQDTLIIFNTYGFSTATMVTRTRLSVTFYVHCPVMFVGVQGSNARSDAWTPL